MGNKKYEKFRDEMLERLKKEFPGYEVKLEKGGSAYGESVSIRNGKGAAPVIKLEECYKSYRNCGDMDEIMKIIRLNLQRMKGEDERAFELVKKLGDWDYVKTHVAPAMVNTKISKDYLKKKPHREFADMSIMYKIYMPEESASAAVTDSMLKRFGITEKKLHDLAVKNIRKIFRPNRLSAQQIEEMQREMGMSREEMIDGEADGHMFYVVTSDAFNDGAAAMLDRKIMDKLCEEADGRVYIIPASRHEFITVSANDKDIVGEDYLRWILGMMNRGEDVGKQHKLSDHILVYTKEDGLQDTEED